MLAVDCFMVRAIVTGLALKRVESARMKQKVTRERRARPIGRWVNDKKTRVWQSPKPLAETPIRLQVTIEYIQ